MPIETDAEFVRDYPNRTAEKVAKQHAEVQRLQDRVKELEGAAAQVTVGLAFIVAQDFKSAEIAKPLLEITRTALSKEGGE